MGKMNIMIPDDLEEDFRLAAAQRLGMKKGNLGIALEQALSLWILTKAKGKKEKEMKK